MRRTAKISGFRHIRCYLRYATASTISTNEHGAGRIFNVVEIEEDMLVAEEAVEVLNGIESFNKQKSGLRGGGCTKSYRKGKANRNKNARLLEKGQSRLRCRCST